MTIKEKLRTQEEIRNYLYSIGFEKRDSYSDKVFKHNALPNLIVYVCYHPCNWGTIINYNGVDIFKNKTASLEEVKRKLAEYDSAGNQSSHS